jgi:NAD-dependent DNA ligase
MTRSGDVIPYILEVVKSTTAEMPACYENDYVWSENEVDLVLKNMNNDEVKIKKLISWATALDIPNLKDGSVRSLFEKGHETPADIVNVNRTTMVAIVGKNGNKILDGMSKSLTDIDPEKLFGSSPCFGVGLGVRKFKALFEVVDYQKLLDNSVTLSDISSADKFNDKTAQKVLDGLPAFLEYIDEIRGKFTIASAKQIVQGRFTGMKICFTGFRDKDLEESVEAQGGEISGGVSKNTDLLVAVDIKGESGKIGKAKDLGIKTISKEDFKKEVDKDDVVVNNDSDKGSTFLDFN